MFAVAAMPGPSDEAAPALRFIGAAPLAALMAAARVELVRERASCGADAPNSGLACSSAPPTRAERR